MKEKKDIVEVNIDKPKNSINEKIILFVVGVLVGAVISTGIFLVYTKACNCKNHDNARMQMNGGGMPSMNGGFNGQMPRMDDNNNNNKTDKNNNNQPPEKPSENNTQNNN